MLQDHWPRSISVQRLLNETLLLAQSIKNHVQRSQIFTKKRKFTVDFLAWWCARAPNFYQPPSGFCFLGLMSLKCISTVRHADLAGSYSPRTSNRQNPFGPFRPTGPEMKKVPRCGVRGVCAWYSFNRNLNASDARCKSDPGPRSGNGRRCNEEIIEDGWRSGSPLDKMFSGGTSDSEDSILGCSWGLIGLSFSCPEIIYLPLSSSSASRG